MFSGAYGLSVDDKGRVAVPAPFRTLLSRAEPGPLYVTPFDHDERPHLEVFPAAEFAQIAQQIRGLANRAAAERLKQQIIGRAVMVELDGQGRIVLPQSLRTQARLGARVKVIGADTRFDIWDEVAWDAHRVDAAAFADDLLLIQR